MAIAVRVGAPLTIDGGAPGRRFIPILGGEVSGGLTGEVLPGGGDWQTILPDGALELSAHYILDIAEQGLVEVRSDGLRHAPRAVLNALERGEAVDPASYYFRTSMRFRASAPGLARLNRLLGVAVGRREPPLVRLDVYEVG
jgi:hypothetical protein